MAHARNLCSPRPAITGAVGAVVFACCLAFARPVGAQTSQAYLSLGAGATDLSGGVDWLVVRTPIAVGGEYGVGNLLVGSLAISYQPFARQLQRRAHPFVRVTLTGVSSSPYSAGCIGLGGGLAYWPSSRRFGIRVEAAKLWPVIEEEQISPPVPPLEEFVPRLWTVRGGVAFRW